jgi:leucyl aminopeptidase
MKFNTRPLLLDADSNLGTQGKLPPKSSSHELIIVPVAGKQLIGSAAAWADRQSGGLLAAWLASGELAEKAGSTLVHRMGKNASVERIMLVSLGKDAKAITEKDFLDASLAAAKAALALPSTKAVSCLHATPTGACVNRY